MQTRFQIIPLKFARLGDWVEFSRGPRSRVWRGTLEAYIGDCLIVNLVPSNMECIVCPEEIISIKRPIPVG